MRLFAVGLALLVAGSSARAATSPDAQGPGCRPLQPQVLACTVSPVGGVGTFDVHVRAPAGLVISFNEPLVGMQPPPSSSFRASFQGTTATVIPIRRDPVPGATVHFDTEHVHVTLNLRAGAVADTQILIVDPRKAGRDEEVERRVKEATEGLEERATEEAEEGLFSDIAEHGAEVVELDATPARHDQVVLRARKVVRIGTRRVLIVGIDNRSGDDLEVTKVRVWLASGGAERELARTRYHVSEKSIGSNREVVAAIGLPEGLGRGERLRVRVEFTDSERDVELSGVRP